MNLPEQPATFRPPSPTERPWWWRLENAARDEVALGTDLARERLASHADPESWVGETWPDLAAEGVDAVTLFEHERRVYGPMSLHA